MGDIGDQPAQLAIDTRVDSAGVAIVTVSGELDTSNAASLDTAVAAVTAEGQEQLVFDLGGLRFMDSAGIAVLVGAADRVSTVHLREPSQAVQRVIELTGLSAVLPVES
jgi:anti-sigma B factor antagonist